MLNSSDIIQQYEKTFTIVEIDFARRQRWGEVDERENRPEVARYNREQLRPVIVILNSEGKQILKSFGGFRHPQEALTLGTFVSGKLGLNTTLKEFTAAESK